MTLSSPLDEVTVASDSTASPCAPPPSGFAMQVHGGQHDGCVIRVSTDKCTIGRSPECTVRLASPEFELLHCLIVRGRGGVVARCWREGTTKLNGKDFSVSWMVPGDRLGVGPIELELLEVGGEGPAATKKEQEKHHSPLAERTGVSPQANADAQLTDELAKAQQFLEQLLEERQELLERLRSLEFDLQQANDQRDRLSAVVDELRDDIAGMLCVRKQWEQERKELERQLDEAREGVAPNARQWGPLDAPQPESDPYPDTSPDLPPVVTNDSSSDEEFSVDMKAVLARYGVVMKEDEGEAEKPHEAGSASIASSDLTAKSAGQGSQRAAVSAAADSANPDAAVQAEPAQAGQRRSSMPRINLSALRDVANLNARVDIDRAAHRRGLKEAAYKWSMGLSAIAIGWFITIILKQEMQLARVLSGACWTIAVWWMFLGSLFYRRAVLVNPKRHRKKMATAKNTRKGNRSR